MNEWLLINLLILIEMDGGIHLNITRVFWYAVIICVAIVLWGSFAPDHLNKITASATVFVYNRFGWFYMFVIISMVSFCIFLMFSRFGKIKLRKRDYKLE